jgi:hypothetical protein
MMAIECERKLNGIIEYNLSGVSFTVGANRTERKNQWD